MQYRSLGRTGLRVSVLSYGCGAIGGLMVRGRPEDQRAAIARAIDSGVTYFDTAAFYGDGASEIALGRVLRELHADVTVGSKVRIAPDQRGDIAAAITAGLEASLRRLGRDSIDLFQLHNAITLDGRDKSLRLEAVLQDAIPALEKARQAGKLRWAGITGLGDQPALRAVLDSGAFATAQIPYNLLNPSAAGPLPAGLQATDQEGLLTHAAAGGVGVIGIRILAGGALTGSEARHPTAAQAVEPILSGPSYAADVAAARRLLPLVEQGYAQDLVEAAIRFAIMPEGMSTVLIGTATLAEFEHAAAAAAKGPLPAEATALLARLQAA